MRSFSVGAVLWAGMSLLGLSACAEGEAAAPDAALPGAFPAAPAPDMDADADHADGPALSASGNTDEPTNPSLPVSNEMPGGANLPLTGNGLSLNGNCYAVCASGATDADAMGISDGWGWENQASCLVS